MAEDESSYLRWAREAMGIRVHPAVRIASSESEEGGRGLFVVGTSVSPSNEELVSVPLDAVLSIASPIQAETPAEVRAARILADVTSRHLRREDDALALRVLYERHERRERSRWWPHLAALPADGPPHSLLRWTQAEIDAYLPGTSLDPVARAWRRQVTTDFDEVCRAVRTSSQGFGDMGHSGDCHSTKVPAWACDRGLYEWAVAIIWSRCVTLPGRGKSLVPVFDFANHAFGAPTRHGCKAGDRFVLEFAPGAATVSPPPTEESDATTTPTSSELHIAYASHPSAKLALLYGFAVEPNPHEAVALYAPLRGEEPEWKRRLLSAAGLDAEAAGEAPFWLTLDEPLPDRLVDAQRLARWGGTAPGPDPDTSRPNDDDDALRAFARRLPRANEVAALDALHVAIVHMRDACARTTTPRTTTTTSTSSSSNGRSSVGTDALAEQRLYEDDDDNPRARLAAIVRRAEYRVLDASCRRLDARLARLRCS